VRVSLQILRELSILIATVRAVWRMLVPARVRTLAQPVLARVAERTVMHALRDAALPHRPGPLIVSGLMAEAKGVSFAAKLTVAGLSRAGFKPFVHDLRPLLSLSGERSGETEFVRPGGVWLMHVNAPEAMRALAALPTRLWKDRYRIGYWAYELPRIPADWVRAAHAFDELWVPSRFVAAAMAASGIVKPIRVMPHPVGLEILDAGVSADDGSFTVMAMGDFASSAERKNLPGAIDIYTRAFPDIGAGRRLVIKTHSGASTPAAARAVARLAKTRPDISIVDRAMPHAEVIALIAKSQVLLSPHRAEGYGLALAEALLLGVPVLATGWSGNLDFMEGLDELLIDHSLVPVRDPSGVYRAAAQSWAEPDPEDGARKLKALYASPVRRAELARLGMHAVQSQMDSWSRESLVDLARLIA
jgi:glycosyltransferase involved in cell wall biosynthesis